MSEHDQPVQVARDGGIATVTINRPQAMNALDNAVKVGLLDAVTEVAGDPEVRCVVLRGAGDRAFCVGQDLKEHVASLQRADASLGNTVTDHYNPIVTTLLTMDKPLVAAVNGVAAGAGASLALAADLRVMVDTGGINFAFAGIALSCDTGASWNLTRLVGPARAKELLFLPRTIPAAECLTLGLVTRVVTADDFESAVEELSSRLAAGPTRAYGAIRRAVTFSAGHSLEESLAHEATLMSLTGSSEDHRAAVDAFLAKEKPTFHGR